MTLRPHGVQVNTNCDLPRFESGSDMAIKIKSKKKSDKSSEVEELEVVEGEPVEDDVLPPADDIDQFLETTTSSFNWAANNQGAVIGLVVAVLAITAGIVFFQEGQLKGRVEISDTLTASLDVLNAPVGDEEPFSLAADPKIKYKGPKFDDGKAKFAELASKSDVVLQKYGQEGAAEFARLMKARALFEQGKAGEASALYQEWLGANGSSIERPFVLQALANAQAADGKVDAAVSTLGELKKLDADTYGEMVDYQTGVFYESAGKKAEAKKAFEAMIKDHEKSPRAEMARMRLDLM